MKDPISTNDMFFWITISFAVAAPLLLLLQNFLSWKKKTNSRRLAPGPPGWPLIGNLLDLGCNYKALHKKLVQLQKIYGPVLMIRMRAMNMLVIASADAATELFKSHDQAFLNRHPVQALQTSIGDYATPWAAPYGPIWRMHRRLYATLFSRRTMMNTLGKRKQFVDQTKQWILVDEKEGRSVEIKHLTMVAFSNLLGNLFFSKDVMDLKSATENELYQLLRGIGALTTKPNLADLFPWLRNLDPQNLANRMKKAIHACQNIVDGFAKERRSTRNNNDEKDYWDLLMDFEGSGKDEPKKLSDRQNSWFITETFICGVDTVTTPIEWVMTEVMRNPEVMRKAKYEIAEVVGYNRMIEGSDIESLPYLGAVIKETLRLHPTGPVLIPRTTVEDTEFMGYIIPKDTEFWLTFGVLEGIQIHGMIHSRSIQNVS
ncbi:cytochrome P450 76A2-like [Papaver somniferum]|uniref:cytochrome P450 76A2-like n=1 Tax=Papaver somniferum TaxID=3469 RepID=UPI000E6F9E16|nr:cytochrome P450 76A2-like [Papaver somniferum]